MKPLVKVPLIYGSIAGVIGLCVVIGLYLIDRHPFLIPVYMDYRIFLFGIFIFFSLKELRSVHYSGILYFWQGIIASFIFITVFALIASAAIGIFATAVPEFTASYIKLQKEMLEGLPKEVVERIGKVVVDSNLKALPSTNAADLSLLYFWQSFMIGLFISIILSVISRRQPKT